MGGEKGEGGGLCCSCCEQINPNLALFTSDYCTCAEECNRDVCKLLTIVRTIWRSICKECRACLMLIIVHKYKQ